MQDRTSCSVDILLIVLVDTPFCATVPKTLAKRVSNGYGLLDDSQTKYLNGIALGWLPDFTVPGAVNTINNAIDRPMSIIGDYVGVGMPSLDWVV